MGNTITNTNPIDYFTQLGATIITQDGTTFSLLYETLMYTFVSHNDHYVISQVGGKVHSVRTLKECGSIMKADVNSLLGAHSIYATVWKGDGTAREVRFTCSHIPKTAKPLFENKLTNALQEFGTPVHGLSKVGQILVNMDASAITHCKTFMKGKIHINWMDVSN